MSKNKFSIHIPPFFYISCFGQHHHNYSGESPIMWLFLGCNDKRIIRTMITERIKTDNYDNETLVFVGYSCSWDKRLLIYFWDTDILFSQDKLISCNHILNGKLKFIFSTMIRYKSFILIKLHNSYIGFELVFEKL